MNPYRPTGRGDQVEGGILYRPHDRVLEPLLRDAEDRGLAVGVDTETEGADPKEVSAYGRASVVCWSLGIPGRIKSTRGVYLAQRVFLLPEDIDRLAPWLAGPAPKVFHNAPWDLDVLPPVGNWHDSLRLSRLLRPAKGDHDLKSSMVNVLGYEPVGEYKDLFRRPRTKVRVVKDRVECCRPVADIFGYCDKCKAGRKYRGYRVEEREEVVELKSFVEVPLREIVEQGEEHPLYGTLLDYATLDAKGTAELYQVQRRQLAGRAYRLPTLNNKGGEDR